MNPRFSRSASLLLLLALLLTLIPKTAYAQSVLSVNPTSVSGGVATVITVSGSGFDNNSRIFLDGTEVPGTVFVDAATLRVTIPADTTLGSHVITVSSASGSVTLDVTAPVPTSTSAPAPVVRPQIAVQNYRTKPENVQYGQEFV